MSFKNLGDMFSYKADQHGGKKYLYFNGVRYTYGEANIIMNKVAKILIKMGLGKGERIGVLLENSPEFIFSFFAIVKCGAVAVPINTFLKTEEVSYILNDCSAKFLITSNNFKDVASPLSNMVKSLKSILCYDNADFDCIHLSKMMKSEKGDNLRLDINEEDLALFIYTSGTTGNPKGAMLTHKNLLSDVDGCNKAFKVTIKDKILLVLPMFHSYTFTACVLIPTTCGCEIIILSSVMELKKKSFKKILIFQRPTFFLGVPQIFSALAKADMPAWFLKFVYPIKIHVSGGAPLPEEIIKEFYKKFKSPVIEGYGLSEASPVVSVNRLEKQKAYSVGPAIPGVSVKIINDEEEEVPIGEVGELIVQGPNVMKGYWNMPDATQEAIKNGWLFTGDMAKLDKDGYIYIVDRKKDLIIVKGINVYPREIEDIIYTYEGVAAAAVIGVKDKASGEAPEAYVTAKDGVTLDGNKIKEYLKTHLANFKIPKHIHIVHELPMTATGKVLKRKLKSMITNNEEII